MKPQESKDTIKRLLHLVLQARSAVFIRTVYALKLIQKSLKSSSQNKNYAVVTAIATNRYTPADVLQSLIENSDSYVKTLIAMRDNLDESMQKTLYEDRDFEVLLALSHNPKLSKNIAVELILDDCCAKNIAKYIELDEQVFRALLGKYTIELAKNETLTHSMQQQLFSLHEDDVQIALASNAHLDEGIVTELIGEGVADISMEIYANTATPSETLEEAFENPANHTSLARNEKTPLYILKILANSDDEKVLAGLARNPATPLEILHALFNDPKYKLAVASNQTFLSSQIPYIEVVS